MLEVRAEERDEIRAWLELFGGHVRRREFMQAARLFDSDVLSFSSLRDVVVGLDALVDEQWRMVWPVIEGFRFDMESLHVFGSVDGRMAVVAVTWTSTGFDRGGREFERPGRATIALGRDAFPGPWLGVHAHFSLNRGVPQQSFGPGSHG